MRNILVINTSGLGVGGITTHMLNYIEQLHECNITMHFTIVVSGVRDNKMLNCFQLLGCDLEFLPDRKKDLFNYLLAINKLLKKKKFDVIHVHGNSSSMCFELIIGKYLGVPVRIAHCHNSKCEHTILNRLLLPFFKKVYTDALACSNLAGNWLFGKDNFTVIHNAIDLNRFCFSNNYRIEYRKKLAVTDDCLLLGHVGGFNEQKNHDFLIDVFYKLQKEKKTELILIGDGFLLHEIKEKCEKLDILSKVHFLGLQNDVERWLCAMDVFVFPSRWEGLGMVAIEAQATGLPVLASTEVPQEACLTTYMKFLDLNQGVQSWVNLILTMYELNKNRMVEKKQFVNYDISMEMIKLLEIYMS